jgi:glycosyltransferase involved in cell wall biosynthesis
VTSHQRPRFSIVIPTLNRAEYLRACLDSIYRQDYTDYEIVVVDGGSSDGTSQVLQACERPVRVITELRKGPSIARNVGVEASRGHYVVFVDSDDFLSSSALSTYAAILDANPEAVMVLAAFRPFHDQRDLAGFGATTLPQSHRFATYLDAAAAGHVSGTHRTIIERELYLAAGGLSDRLTVCEDQDFGLRVSDRGPCVVVIAPETIGYRAHPGNISSNIGDFGFGALALVRAERRGDYPGGRPRQRLRRSVIARSARSTSVACLREGRYRDGCRLYIATLTWHLAQWRLNYMLGFPILALTSLVRQRGRST